MKFPRHLPVIGSLIAQRNVRKTIGAAAAGDADAVRDLVRILAEHPDNPTGNPAQTTLRILATPALRDAFCDAVLAPGNERLIPFAADCGHRPTDPEKRALFLFLTGQIGQRPDIDFPLLAKAYAGSGREMRARLLRGARANGHCGILASALCDPDHSGNPGSWSHEEWDVIVTGFAADSRWDDLWQLIPSAPPGPAVTGLNALKVSGWKPGPHDAAVWEALCEILPASWPYPFPAESLIRTIRSPDSQPVRLAFSPDGTLLAAGYSDGSVTVWNTGTARHPAMLDSGTGPVKSLFFSQSGDRVYCLRGSGLHCLDTMTGIQTWEKSPDEAMFTCAELCDDSSSIALGTTRGLMVCDARTGKTITSTGSGLIGCLAISRDTKKIAIGHGDGSLILATIDDGSIIHIISGNGKPVHELAFFVEGEILCSVCRDSNPVLWDTDSGERLRTWTGQTGPIACSEVIPGLSMLALAGMDNQLRIWGLAGTHPAASIPFYHRHITCCSADIAGTTLATGCGDGTIRIIHLPDGAITREFRPYKKAVATLQLSHEGTVLASAGWDGSVILHDPRSGETLRTLQRRPGAITGLCQVPGTARVAASSSDGSVRLFRHEDGRPEHILDMYTPAVNAIAVSPDGRFLACAGSDKSLRIWNLSNTGLAGSGDLLSHTARCLVFHPDGNSLISGGWDGKVRLWTVPGREPVQILSGHTSIVTSCAFSPDGTLLVTSSNDTTVRLWSLPDRKCRAVLTGARSEISAVAVSPDGNLLAAGSSDGVIRVYSLPGGEIHGSAATLPGKVTALTFLPDNQILAAGYDTGHLTLLSCPDPELIKTFPAHTGPVTGIIAMPEEDSIITGGHDGLIRVFQLPFFRPLSRATLHDIRYAAEQAALATQDETRTAWEFLHRLLMLRFRDEICVISQPGETEAWEIQVVG